jgi:hypothetical protein
MRRREEGSKITVFRMRFWNLIAHYSYWTIFEITAYNTTFIGDEKSDSGFHLFITKFFRCLKG